MKVLKWFENNLCNYEEFIASETPEEKIILGEELFDQMYRLAEMEVYAFLREKNAYIWPGRVYKFANRICKVNRVTNIFTNHYYKIRLKDGLNIEEYGVKAVHFERVYPIKTKKKRKAYLEINEKHNKNALSKVYKALTKNSINHNEYIELIKILYTNFKTEHNCYYRQSEAIIPGKFFIRGKEFPEIRIVLPWLSDVKRNKCKVEINRCTRYPYAENVYTLSTITCEGRPFEMGKGGWMLSSENCWNM